MGPGLVLFQNNIHAMLSDSVFASRIQIYIHFISKQNTKKSPAENLEGTITQLKWPLLSEGMDIKLCTHLWFPEDES